MTYLADVSVYALPPLLQLLVAARIVCHCVDCFFDNVQALPICETLQNHPDIFKALGNCGILQESISNLYTESVMEDLRL